jgi:hypothetical protein
MRQKLSASSDSTRLHWGQRFIIDGAVFFRARAKCQLLIQTHSTFQIVPSRVTVQPFHQRLEL